MRPISFIIIFGLFSCTHLTPEQKLIKETLGKTVDIDIFESIWQGEREILDRSVLIGPDNKIKLIGPPFASPQMAELFYNIVNSEI